MAIRRKGRTAALAAVFALASTAAACGGGGGGSIPRSLARAESAAQDTIGLVLGGKRQGAVRSAATLDKLAHEDLEKDLEGMTTKEELGEFQGRAAELAGLAPDGEPIAVALAANRAFEMIARFYGRFETDVPGVVMQLDYLGFEAKLRALARELDPLRTTVDQLARTWAAVSTQLPPGEEASAARTQFDGHVAAMGALAAAGTDFDGLVKEAQRGLDLVDELKGVF